ncbi:MAG: carboxymuconolactone decarboxylase family protein [Planctomycetales bacterium]|nr:carboxymuconolactone decarboxylase family protein [Planctomycetales bacterium]
MLDLTSDRPPGALARGLALAGVLAARGRDGDLAALCDAWLGAKLPAAVLAEGLMQTYLFLGFPRALNALRVFRERESAAGLPPSPDPGDDPDRDSARSRGEALCGRVYGPRTAALVAHVRSLHPALARQMVEEGYGRILGRPGLDPVVRELAAVGSLVPERVPRQLRAHLRGALNLGARPEEVAALLKDLKRAVPARAYAEAQALLAEVAGVGNRA